MLLYASQYDYAYQIIPNSISVIVSSVDFPENINDHAVCLGVQFQFDTETELGSK